MTYLEIIKKMLDFYLKEPISLEFLDYWGIASPSEEDFKRDVKCFSMYILLKELNKFGNLTEQYKKTLNYLENGFIEPEISIKEIFDELLRENRKKYTYTQRRFIRNDHRRDI